MQGEIACLLFGLGVEVIQNRYMMSSFKAPLFVSSRAAKGMKADIGSASRVLGILFTTKSAYAFYKIKTDQEDLFCKMRDHYAILKLYRL